MRLKYHVYTGRKLVSKFKHYEQAEAYALKVMKSVVVSYEDRREIYVELPGKLGPMDCKTDSQVRQLLAQTFKAS